jgi:hypothetical protein
LNAICKDNVAINFISVRHKKGSFPSNLTGHLITITDRLGNTLTSFHPHTQTQTLHFCSYSKIIFMHKQDICLQFGIR